MTLFEPHDSNFPSHFGGFQLFIPLGKDRQRTEASHPKDLSVPRQGNAETARFVNGWSVFGGSFFFFLWRNLYI